MFINKKIIDLTILAIIILASFLRLWEINNTPPGVLVDEASFGYNAYSILLTGKDEWEEKYPLTFRSFGDFKPPGYIYLTVPFVKLFGLNPFSTRILSSISGIVTVYLIFLLVKLLTRNKEIALLSSFILAISPWHIYMSRMAWDSNIALMFLISGLFLFIKSINAKVATLTLSALFFSLALYSYAGYRLLTPILVGILLVFCYIKKTVSFKKVMLFVFFVFIFTSPLIPEIFFRGALTRFNQVSIFNDKNNAVVIDEKRAFCGMQHNKTILKLCYVVWNKPLVITTTFLKRYITSYSFDFLFYPGDKALFLNNPEHGGLYYWLIPFFVLGLLFFFKNYKKTNYQIIFIVLVVAPIATVVSGSPHYERANLVFIPVTFICALGVNIQYQIAKKIKLRYLSIILFLIISLSATFVTMMDYFFVYTKSVEAWDEHQSNIYRYVKKVESNYKYIFIKKINNDPYIYLTYYLSLNPVYFHNNVKRDGNEVISIGKYQFIDSDFNSIYCKWLADKQRVLLVTDEYIEDVTPVFKVTSFNGVYTRAAIYDLEISYEAISNNNNKNIACP